MEPPELDGTLTRMAIPGHPGFLYTGAFLETPSQETLLQKNSSFQPNASFPTQILFNLEEGKAQVTDSGRPFFQSLIMSVE